MPIQFVTQHSQKYIHKFYNYNTLNIYNLTTEQKNSLQKWFRMLESLEEHINFSQLHNKPLPKYQDIIFKYIDFNDAQLLYNLWSRSLNQFLDKEISQEIDNIYYYNKYINLLLIYYKDLEHHESKHHESKHHEFEKHQESQHQEFEKHESKHHEFEKHDMNSPSLSFIYTSPDLESIQSETDDIPFFELNNL